MRKRNGQTAETQPRDAAPNQVTEAPESALETAVTKIRQLGLDMTALLATKHLLEPDGTLINDASYKLRTLPEDQQKAIKDAGDILAFEMLSLGIDLFSLDPIPEVPQYIRRRVTREAGLVLSQEKPEDYLAFRQAALEHGHMSPFASKEAEDRDYKDALSRFTRRQSNIIVKMQRTDPVEAVNIYIDTAHRAEKLGLESIETPYDFNTTVKTVLEQLEKAGGDTLAFFRTLPDVTPGLESLAEGLVRTKLNTLTGSSDSKKAMILETFQTTAPDVLLAHIDLTSRFDKETWSKDDLTAVIKSAAQFPGAKKAILARVGLPPNPDQATLDIFEEAYRKYAPKNLVVHAEFFPHVSFDQQLATRLVESSEIDTLMRHLDLFQGLTPELAKELIQKGWAKDVLKRADKFGLTFDTNLACLLLRKGQADVLRTHLEAFGDPQVLLNDLIAILPDLVIAHSDKLPTLTSEQLLTVLRSDKVKLTQQLEMLKRQPDIVNELPWGKAILALEKTQARATNAEHDPWTTDLNPLVRAALEQKIIAVESRADGELLVLFVREFGAVNAVKMFETFVTLKRAKALDDLPEHVREQLNAIFGDKRLDKLRTPEAIINELRNYRRQVTASLLRDEIPVGIHTLIGAEIFVSLKGTSRWELGHDTGKLLKIWEKTTESKPEITKVPEGYAEATMSVRVRTRAEAGDQLTVDARRLEILQNTDVQTRFQTFREYFQAGLKSIPEIVVEAQTQLTADIREQVAKNEARLASASDKAKIGIQKNLEALYGYANQIAELSSSAKPEDLIKTVVAMRGKAVIFDSLLRSLSVAHIRQTAPPEFTGIIEGLGRMAGQADATDLIASRDFIVDYLNEHYLHKEQNEQHTGHPALPDEVVKTLKQIWQITAGPDEHPLVKAGNELRELNKGKLSEDKIKISLVPAQGPLRIISGDIGDACYTSQHVDLAKGEFPNLHAMIFVTGRNTANEKFGGSALFIETESDTGEKVLMVRANNPRENLLQGVDADELVALTLGEAVTIAERRKITRVVVPLDPVSASSSNRRDVAKYYQTHFSQAPKIGLKNEPETNFNCYQNWNKDSVSPVVEIWRNPTAT